MQDADQNQPLLDPEFDAFVQSLKTRDLPKNDIELAIIFYLLTRSTDQTSTSTLEKAIEYVQKTKEKSDFGKSAKVVSIFRDITN